MITRSGSRRDLRSRGDSIEMITPMRRESKIQRMKKSLNESESESEGEKFKSPVFNIHIHVPPFNGNNPTLMLPRIQPVIHLHFDELAKGIDNNSADNSKTLKEFLKNTPGKFNKIKFHYSNNMCLTDTSDVNKDTYKLNTSSRKKTVNSKTDFKKNNAKVFENTQNITDEEDNSSSKGDKDNFATGTRFSAGLRNFSHRNLRRCTSTPTNKNGNSRNTADEVDLCGLEKQYNLKKAVVLLTDCRKEATLEERKNKANSTNVSYRLSNNEVQGNKMDINSLAKKPVSQSGSVQNGSPEANDISKDGDDEKDLKDSSDEELEKEVEQLVDDSEEENQLVIDCPSEEELRKESEGPQISVNGNCYKGDAAYSNLTPPDSMHEKASLNKNNIRNEDGSESSKIVQDVIQTPSTPQLHVKAIESLRSTGTPQIPSCHNEIICSTSEGLITPTRTASEFEAMLSLSRKNGGIYSRVYGSDEETPKRKRSESLTNIVEGCNFSEILRTFTQKKEDTNKSVRNSCPAKINEEVITAKQYLPLEGRICRKILQNSPSPNREQIDNEEPKEICSECENITFNSSPYIDKCNTSENSKTASTTQSNHETISESEFIMNDHVEPDRNEKCQEEDLNTEEEEMVYGGESEEEIKNKGWSSGNKSINETNEMRKYEIDINVPELELLKKEMLKKNNKNKKNSSSDLKDSNKNKKLHLTPPINCSTPSKKMKLTNEKSKGVSPARSSKKKSIPSTHSELLYIPLNVSGPTKFAVAPINQLTPSSTHKCRRFKESMLYGDRINRFNSSKVLHMYNAKHEARNISASNTR